MPFARTIIQGKTGTFRLSDPRPQIKINKADVDEVTDTWFSDRFPNPLLTEDATHPLYTGLILDNADFEEIAPAFDAIPGSDGQAGDYRVNCRWLGDARGTTPTKFLSRSKTRSIGPEFDSFSESYLSWNAEPRSITGTASTDLISDPGNTFSDGMRVAFVELTGGTGLTALSTSALAVIYYIINRTADGYQVSATLGGSAVNFTTNITAGRIADARFCHGCPHPEWSSMYCTGISISDNYTQWKKVEVTWTGKQFDKPYHRVITCNGVEVSPGDPIFWDVTDGWSDSRAGSFRMPQIVVTDTFVSTATLPTSSIPLSSGEGGAPPNAPAVRSIVFTGADSLFRWRWPNGWSLIDTAHIATLNSGIPVHIYRKTHEYIVAQMFK